MKDRILQFLSAESISPAEFADKIGVQRSSMSHILNGRNHPSASFLQKMLQVYPDLNPRWLMIGDGTMNFVKDQSGSSFILHPESKADEISNPFVIVDNSLGINANASSLASSEDPVGLDSIQAASTHNASENRTFPLDKQPGVMSDPAKTGLPVNSTASNKLPHFDGTSSDEKEIEQVLVFFKDKTFAVYKPS
jgi:transcriptional regulator with XRE-family HTH domain